MEEKKSRVHEILQENLKSMLEEIVKIAEKLESDYPSEIIEIQRIVRKKNEKECGE